MGDNQKQKKRRGVSVDAATFARLTAGAAARSWTKTALVEKAVEAVPWPPGRGPGAADAQ
jgi:hypothetical protein